jgi:hypothetical protein
MRRRLLLTVAAITVLVPGLLGPQASASLARLTNADSSAKALSTDTLDPPTTLAATGGAMASLTWGVTPDTYASGYELRRATVSGGPYTVVSTITPRTTVATTNAPGASGTYHYVLRSMFQNWRSVDSNQASATIVVGPIATGFKACTPTSNAADTGGDNNGYELVAANACSDDLLWATDASSGTNTSLSCTNAGKDRHRYWDFTLGVPATVSSVGGIQVRADVGMNNTGGTSLLCVALSWNGGTTWTTPKSVTLSTSAITTYAFGATNDRWGRTWLGSQLSNANFRVRLIDVTNQPTKSFLLEYLAVQVTYTP